MRERERERRGKREIVRDEREGFGQKKKQKKKSNPIVHYIP